MTIQKSRAIALSTILCIRDEIGYCHQFLNMYYGLEKDGFLYLIEDYEISSWKEPSAYYKVEIKDIPDYDYEDDLNEFYIKKELKPVELDEQLIQLLPEIKEAAEIKKREFK